MELTLLLAYWMFGFGYVSSAAKDCPEGCRTAKFFAIAFVLAIWPVALGADLYKFINGD